MKSQFLNRPALFVTQARMCLVTVFCGKDLGETIGKAVTQALLLKGTRNPQIC